MGGQEPKGKLTHGNKTRKKRLQGRGKRARVRGGHKGQKTEELWGGVRGAGKGRS